MSRRHSLAIPLLGVAFLFTSGFTQAQQLEHRQRGTAPTRVIKTSAWTVGRTLVFGGNARRVQVAVDAAALCWAEVQAEKNSREPTAPKLILAPLGVKPLPLPKTTVARKPAENSEIAVLQRTYRKLVALGLHEEAGEIAELIVRPDEQANNAGAVVNAVAVENEQSAVIQTAGFNRRDSIPWSDSSKSLVSCRFDGATIDEAAKFIEQKTGGTIRVKAGDRPLPRVYFSCQNQPAATVVARMVEGCGWTFETSGNEVVIHPPIAVPLRIERLPILR
jgi:hypothetical protein